MFVKGNRTFVYINFQIFKFGIPILGDGIKILNEDIDLIIPQDSYHESIFSVPSIRKNRTSNPLFSTAPKSGT